MFLQQKIIYSFGFTLCRRYFLSKVIKSLDSLKKNKKKPSRKVIMLNKDKILLLHWVNHKLEYTTIRVLYT